MKNKTNFVIDGLIFLGLLAAAVPTLTGLAIHEWLSLALAGTILVHLILHADWVWGVLKRFFVKLWHSSRLNFVVDLATLIAYVGVMLSGILVSREILGALGIQLSQNRSWEEIHRLTADASVWLTALHLALHWRWIVNSFKRHIFNPLSGLFQRRQPAPVMDSLGKLETVKIEARNER
jgi:hypothetical protein